MVRLTPPKHLFMSEKTFRQLVSPLYSITKASLICISTQSEKAGELVNMLTRKDRNGRSVVRCFRYSAVCPSCVSKGKKDECSHFAHRLPPWQSADKMEQLTVMFHGNEGDMNR